MEITLTIKEIMLLIIGIGLFVLIIYSISLLKNLITTVKSTNKILEDATVVSGIASSRAQELDGTVGDISKSVGEISDILKGNQNIIKALTNIVNALAGLKGLIPTDKR